MNKESDYIIEASELTFQVGENNLLSRVNFNVKKGEHWLLYGMNGCGKTTLLSIIAGYRRQTEGRLKVFGEEFSNDNILATRKRIGWVSSSFFDDRYKREQVLDIVLAGKTGTYGLGLELTSADYRRANRLLKELGLEDKSPYSYCQLSKGQRQNVLIARAFMNKPEILLLDEPCSGLDVLARVRFIDMLKNIMDHTDITVIFVAHELNQLKDLFSHTLLLRNGYVFAQGQTEEMFQEAKLSSFLKQKILLMDIVETEIQTPTDYSGIDLSLFLSQA